ncbi:MAG: hypothetical protein ABI390_10400, partial [Daejeonella sp.]
MRFFCCCFSILFTLFISSCDYSKQQYLKPKPSFEKVKGIEFTEVRRSFKNGLAFSESGFYLEPNWKMKFLFKDSVRLFNPLDNHSYNFHVHLDHDSVIYMARVWMRVKHVSRDSMVFQLLKVRGKEIANDIPTINMIFYADNYIKHNLKTFPDLLQQARKNDSAFVKKRIEKINSYEDSIFFPQQPEELISQSPIIAVKKKNIDNDALKNMGKTDENLLPEYNIIINKSYRDFNYSFYVIIDPKGKIHYRSNAVYIMPEFKESKIRTMKGIIDVYLQRLLKVSPGRTLGMPHNTL